jgi:tetratricopeptide (TPR) repeat protein
MCILRQTLVYFTLCVCFTSVGLAQSNELKNNPRYTTAMKQAETAQRERRYKDAVDALRRAQSISKDAVLFYEIGLIYERLKDKRNALEAFKRFIDEVPSDPRVTDASARVASLVDQLKNQFEEVLVTTQPPGAFIYVDQRANGAQGQTPIRIRLLPGKYTLIAEKDGYVTTQQRLTLQAGAASQVAIPLYSEDEVAPVRFLINRSDAQLYIDRSPKGKSPFDEPLLVRKGPHEIRIVKPGYVPWVKKVTVVAQRPMDVDVILVEEGRQKLAKLRKGSESSGGVGPWVTMGTGVALIGGSAYTGFSAYRLYGQLETKRDQQLLIASNDISTGNNLVLLTNLLIGLGAASLTAGGVWWFMDAPPTSNMPNRRFSDLLEAGASPAYVIGGAQ